MRHHVTPTWSLELPDDADGLVNDDGDLVVNAPGRFIVVSPWDAAPELTPEEALAELQADERPEPVEEHADVADDGTVRWAFMLDETDDDHRYLGLYGYVLAPTEWLQLAVLVDHELDRAWAVDTWRSVRYGESDPGEPAPDEPAG